MKICYFGDYDRDYARNRILIKGLKKNNVEIIECNNRSLRFFWKIKNLYSRHKKISNNYDLMIVGYTPISRFAVPFARLISSKKIIWDAFYSLYDSWVYDKKLVSKYNPKAWYYWFLDWINCRLADKILLDTEEHIKYFVKTFKIKKEKILKVLVGSDDSVFYPRETEKKSDKFIVHFHGNYIPLQGAKYIIQAAEILKDENIVFRMIGSRGQEYKKSVALANDIGLKNIEFINTVSYEKLPELMAEADVCLGIFGDTDKTQRVIPNKVYEALAMAKPVISADTPAIRELLTDRENILLCCAADPKSLADKIFEMKKEHELRNKIAQQGYELFNKHCKTEIVTNQLLNKLN